MLLKNERAGKIALSGVLLALAVVFTIMANMLPAGKLVFYALSSFMVSIVIIEGGSMYAWLFYAASCVLIIILVPDKTALLPYIAFFGFYGIIKFYIEKGNDNKRKKVIFEYALKLIIFNISLAISAILALKVMEIEIGDIIKSNLPWQFAIILAQIVFIMYDYAYNLFIDYYVNEFRGRLNRNNG